MTGVQTCALPIFIETPKMKTAAAPKLAAIEDDEDDESLEFFKKMAAN